MMKTLARPVLLFVGLPVGLAVLFGASIWPLLLAYAVAILLMVLGARDATRPDGALRSKLAGGAFLLFLVFGLPPALASVVDPTIHALLVAYTIWFSLLGVWVVMNFRSRGMRPGEAIGWPIIFAMFLTMLVVPVLTLLLTITGAA